MHTVTPFLFAVNTPGAHFLPHKWLMRAQNVRIPTSIAHTTRMKCAQTWGILRTPLHEYRHEPRMCIADHVSRDWCKTCGEIKPRVGFCCTVPQSAKQLVHVCCSLGGNSLHDSSTRGKHVWPHTSPVRALAAPCRSLLCRSCTCAAAPGDAIFWIQAHGPPIWAISTPIGAEKVQKFIRGSAHRPRLRSDGGPFPPRRLPTRWILGRGSRLGSWRGWVNNGGEERDQCRWQLVPLHSRLQHPSAPH